MKRYLLVKTSVGVALLLGLACSAEAAEKKVKVFILAGQSNMEGHGMLGSLDHLGNHPKYGHLLKKLKDRDGSWATRDDVTIYWNKESKEQKHGPLSTDWGAMTGKSIGPELMFGTIMGQRYQQHVLLIKTAWGGKSVWCDFRSPGAGEMTWDEKRILQRDNWLKPGISNWTANASVWASSSATRPIHYEHPTSYRILGNPPRGWKGLADCALLI